MSITQFWGGLRTRQVDRLSKLVAERSVAPLVAEIGADAHGMSLAETRGFARALASKTIRDAADEVLAPVAMADRLQAQIILRATELVVDDVACEIYQHRHRRRSLRIAG